MLTIGVVGCGHWGPNHIRIFSHLPDSRVLLCADLSPDRLKSIKFENSFIEKKKNYLLRKNSQRSKKKPTKLSVNTGLNSRNITR